MRRRRNGRKSPRRERVRSPHRPADILNTETQRQPLGDVRDEATDILPLIFRGLDPKRRLNILDLGAAEPESIAFFHRYCARVCITNAVEEWGSGSFSSLYEALPDLAKGLCFDVCLFWDSLNHLSSSAMRAFAQDVVGYLHQGTRIHAFAAYTSAWAFDAHRYGIIDEHRLAIKPRSTSVPHPHSQTEIERALTGFRIQRTVLRPGNRLELLLSHRAD